MFHYLADRLQNLVSGLGTSKDKRIAHTFGLNMISAVELAAMHRSDWLARKIVDIIPHDMTREWRLWQAKGSNTKAKSEEERQGQIGPIEDEESRLGVRQKIADALQKARLFGGAGIVIGTGEAPESELRPDTIRKGGLLYLNVLSRQELGEEDLDTDVLSPFFRQPKFYTVTGARSGRVRVHPSRIVRFIGAPILDQTTAPDSWGDSVLQVVYDAVQNAASTQDHIASLIPEAKVDVIKVPGLSDHLSTAETTARLTSRFTYAATMKSQFNMLLLEGDGQTGESWEQKELGFGQLPELMRQFLQIASGAADIPVTRLLGESPAGLNSTGESDIRNYYDNVSARQELELRPALTRLDELLIRSALGLRPAEIYYEWAPLWQLSEKERAEIQRLKTEAAEKDADMGLIPLPALARARANQLVEDGVYPGLEAAIEEFGDPGDYAEEERAAKELAAREMAQAQGEGLTP